ncbi:hypothetical protein REPUB_Repub02eG0187800 [Reevesia pubescens]
MLSSVLPWMQREGVAFTKVPKIKFVSIISGFKLQWSALSLLDWKVAKHRKKWGDETTDPRLTDYDMLLQNVHDLKEGKEVQVPTYDFKASSRTGYRGVAIFQKGVIYLLIFLAGHPWVQVDGLALDKPLDSVVLSRLKQFFAMKKLKKIAIRVVSMCMH